MTALIGPTFALEIAAAGLTGLPFSWGADGVNVDDPRLTDGNKSAIAAVVSAHNPATPNPNDEFAALIAAGCPITSTGTPAINSSYSIDPAAQGQVTSEAVYIQVTGKFTNGGTVRGWADAAGAYHTFINPAQFTAFAEALAAYVDGAATALATALAAGHAGAWAWTPPAAPDPIP